MELINHLLYLSDVIFTEQFSSCLDDGYARSSSQSEENLSASLISCKQKICQFAQLFVHVYIHTLTFLSLSTKH